MGKLFYFETHFSTADLFCILNVVEFAKQNGFLWVFINLCSTSNWRVDILTIFIQQSEPALCWHIYTTCPNRPNGHVHNLAINKTSKQHNTKYRLAKTPKVNSIYICLQKFYVLVWAFVTFFESRIFSCIFFSQ